MNESDRPLDPAADPASPAAAEVTPDAMLAGSAESRRRGLYLLLSLAILVLDQASKWMVEKYLVEHSQVSLIPGLLNFVHVRNTGVAFGLFPAHGDFRGTLVLAGLGLFALSFVFYYFWNAPLSDRPLLIALSSIIGGAIGNLIDRLASGGVTDFIDFHFQGYHWHTFNVADSAITIGICLMLLTSLRPARDQPVGEAPPAGVAG
jgi:signal peptidase II